FTRPVRQPGQSDPGEGGTAAILSPRKGSLAAARQGPRDLILFARVSGAHASFARSLYSTSDRKTLEEFAATIADLCNNKNEPLIIQLQSETVGGSASH